MAQSWGYSGTVGEWHFSLRPAIAPSDAAGRFSNFMQVWEKAAPIVESMHVIRSCSVDIVFYDSEMREVGALEDESLTIQRFSELDGAISRLVAPHSHFIIAALFLSLDTNIISETGEKVAPESGELYLGTSPGTGDDHQYFIHLSYSTYIDIWLEQTFGADGDLRDNATLARLNLPRLEAFLEALRDTFGATTEPGDSSFYRDRLTTSGFKTRAPR